MKRILTTSAAVLAICLLAAGTLCAQSDEPSLGDVARQKSAAKAKHVVTNDEIPPSPEANNAPAAAAKPGAPAQAAPDPKVEPSPKTEQPPDNQARIKELTNENANLHKVVDSLQEKLNSATNQNLIEALNEALQHAREQLSKNENDIDKLKSAAPAPSSDAAAPGSSGTPGSAPAPSPSPK